MEEAEEKEDQEDGGGGGGRGQESETGEEVGEYTHDHREGHTCPLAHIHKLHPHCRHSSHKCIHMHSDIPSGRYQKIASLFCTWGLLVD